MKKSKRKAIVEKERRTSVSRMLWCRRPAAAAALIAIAALAVYVNSLSGGFVFDDTVIVQNNKAIQGLDAEHLRQIFGGHYWQAVESRGGLYRPVVMLSYAANYAWGKEDPVGYHLANILLHAANGVLVYLILQALFSSWELSILSALFFVLHPIRTEAVASVVGRAEVLSAFFMLLAWWSYLESRNDHRRLWLWLSSGAFVLAALSKESALSFVLLLPMTDLLSNRGSARNRLTGKETFFRYLPFGVALLFVLGLRRSVLGGFAPLYINPGSNALAATGAGTRFLTATNVFARYLYLMIFPINLSADYSYNQIPLVTTLFSVGALLPLLLLLLLAAGLALALRKHPVLFFSGASFLATFILTSNWLRPIGTIMAERLMYFPALGFNCASAYLISEGVARVHWRSVALGVAAVLTAGYGLRTVSRNGDWKSDYTLFISAAETSPNSELVQSNCAVVLLDANDVSGAIEHAKRALSIQPDDPGVHFTLARAFRLIGNLPDSAIAFSKVVQLAPRTSGGTEALRALARIHEDMRQYSAAGEDYRKLIDWRPTSASSYLDLYRIYLRMGQNERAIEVLNRAARVDPNNPAVQKARQEQK